MESTEGRLGTASFHVRFVFDQRPFKAMIKVLDDQKQLQSINVVGEGVDCTPRHPSGTFAANSADSAARTATSAAAAAAPGAPATTMSLNQTACLAV